MLSSSDSVVVWIPLINVTPENGAEMDASRTYFYDIQIYDPVSGSYDKVFTLLTGSISVTDDVTQGDGS